MNDQTPATFKLSSVVVCVFAATVLGKLVKDDDMNDTVLVNTFVQRLDTLGYMPIMITLSQNDVFIELMQKAMDDLPMDKVILVLSHACLVAFGGAEGLVAQAAIHRQAVLEEARGCDTTTIMGEQTPPTAAVADVSTTLN